MEEESLALLPAYLVFSLNSQPPFQHIDSFHLPSFLSFLVNSAFTLLGLCQLLFYVQMECMISAFPFLYMLSSFHSTSLPFFIHVRITNATPNTSAEPSIPSKSIKTDGKFLSSTFFFDSCFSPHWKLSSNIW